MPKYNYNESSNTSDQNVLYDLRTFRMFMIARYWDNLYNAQQSHNYKDWFYSLERIEAVVNHLISEKNEDSEFENLKEKVITIINKNNTVYVGKSNSIQGKTEIEDALEIMEKYLFRKMKEKNVFGKGRDLSGL